MKTKFTTSLLWLMSITIPFFIIMTSVRLLVNPLYPQIEYQMPGFPDDHFGFTADERLHWSKFAVNYLLNNEDISYLGDLRFDNGDPLYNERELRHMVDVKVLIQAMIKAWWILLAFLFVSVVWLCYSKEIPALLRTLSRGGKFTIGLIVLILLATVISFQELFTQFHRLFFRGDTWLFLYSDTLIRLFPIRFWQDAFILMGLFSITGSILLIFLGKRYSK